MAVYICDVSLEIDSKSVVGEIELDTNDKKTQIRILTLPSPSTVDYIKDVTDVFESIARFYAKYNDLKEVKIKKKI